jgi:hypothetical protein
LTPDSNYIIGHEKGAGKNGNAPILLWDFWPVELAFFIPILLWSYPFLPRFEFSIVGVIFVILMLILAGFTFLIGFHLLLRFRFRNSYYNTELELLINQAKSRMGYSSNCELWLYSSLKQILLPLSFPFFKVIVLSDSAVDDILASREDGEIILADVLTSLEGRAMLSTWIPLFSFVLLSLFTFPWTGIDDQTARSIVWLILWVFFLIMSSTVVWSPKSQVELVEQEYKVNSDTARYIVFRKEPPNDTELSEIEKRSHHPFSRPVSHWRRGVSFIAAVACSVFAWIIIQNFVAGFELNTNLILSILYIYAPFNIALFTFLVVSICLDKILKKGESTQNRDV